MFSIDLDSEDEAAPDSFPFNNHGTSSAHAMFAANMRPSKPKVMTKKICQGKARLDLAIG
jgi:hypothetical protein